MMHAMPVQWPNPYLMLAPVLLLLPHPTCFSACSPWGCWVWWKLLQQLYSLAETLGCCRQRWSRRAWMVSFCFFLKQFSFSHLPFIPTVCRSGSDSREVAGVWLRGLVGRKKTEGICMRQWSVWGWNVKHPKTGAFVSGADCSIVGIPSRAVPFGSLMLFTYLQLNFPEYFWFVKKVLACIYSCRSVGFCFCFFF